MWVDFGCPKAAVEATGEVLETLARGDRESARFCKEHQISKNRGASPCEQPILPLWALMIARILHVSKTPHRPLLMPSAALLAALRSARRRRIWKSVRRGPETA